MAVESRGNGYVNGVGLRFGEQASSPGLIALVTPDGPADQVADGPHPD
jgi:hypothetical protein